ncbi:MAG: hypothetical protein RL172_701 [Bacteroidota bacterium]|jgi:hypothetical protein
MKNRRSVLCGIAMLCCVMATTMISCKKNDAAFIQLEQADELSLPQDDVLSIDTVLNTFNETGIAGNTAMPEAAYVRKNLLFNYTTELSNSLTALTAYSTSYWNTLAKCCTHSIQRSTAYSRSGSYATRYELNKTDADVASSKRTESNRFSRDEKIPYVERWYGSSYYLPSEFVSDNAPEILTQWHTTVGGNPPLALWTHKGQWKIVQFGTTSTVIGNYERNKWTDFVFHIKWSAGADGLIEIWKGGVKVFSKTGKNIYSGLTYGAYMKAGIYKWAWKSGTFTSSTTKRVVYIDDVRIGNAAATYNDVAPGL